MGEVEGMTVNDRKRIDNIIKEYLLAGIRIKILKAKIKIAKAKIIHAEYENNKFIVLKNKKILHELGQLMEIVESNVKNDYLEKLEIFKMDIVEAMEEFNINKNNLFKLKREILEEFYKVLDIVEAR